MEADEECEAAGRSVLTPFMMSHTPRRLLTDHHNGSFLDS